MRLLLSELMDRTGVRFGTSGVRGLAIALTDQVAYLWTRGFLQYLGDTGDFARAGGHVAVAGDLRPSTARLQEAVCRAVEDTGHRPLSCGQIPSPALAHYGFTHRIPSVMVTGSHIPVDRNGLKFNKSQGEILKADEAGISGQAVSWDGTLFDPHGAFKRPARTSRGVTDAAKRAYVARYLDLLTPHALDGVRLGLYQHSAVGRDLLVEIFGGLGARVTPLGRSKGFVPVDTEAIRPADVQLAMHWSKEHQWDALISTDGDSDRPLISDAEGHWLRGDIAGILCAYYLQADSVSTPVSCNSAVELCGWFREVRRTRIGSPYVIESMREAAARGARRVVGYEANGGFLIQSHLEMGGKMLCALPTRDAVILILSVLLLARRERKTIAQLVQTLPPRYTWSDRLCEFPPEKSQAVLARFATGDDPADRRTIEETLELGIGAVKVLDRTDGLRITFENEEVVHLRPSGNAPEFRCYSEAASEARAMALNRRCLARLRDWKD